MAKKATKRTVGRKTAARRELIDTGTDKRFVRRGAAGKFKESDDVGSRARPTAARKPRRRLRVAKATEATGSDTRRTPVRRVSATSRKVTRRPNADSDTSTVAG